MSQTVVTAERQQEIESAVEEFYKAMDAKYRRVPVEDVARFNGVITNGKSEVDKLRERHGVRDDSQFRNVCYLNHWDMKDHEAIKRLGPSAEDRTGEELAWDSFKEESLMMEWAEHHNIKPHSFVWIVDDETDPNFRTENRCLIFDQK